jgi:DNA invertase Pin-like site-specific DNA recombinase
MKCKMVAYYRVSTVRQGQSGLGLDAQKEAVLQHVTAHGCDLIGAYTEIETAKKDGLENRPELRKAIAHAKRCGATLVIAKLDRLSRSVYVTAQLHKSSVEFVACDNPTANRLTIQILAAVAEDEARRISERTKAALAAYKRRGGRLGASLKQCRNLTAEARLLGAQRAHKKAREEYEDVSPWMVAQRSKRKTLQEIADALNADGRLTRRNKAWTPMQVKRVIERG